jgi:hypothetical protein
MTSGHEKLDEIIRVAAMQAEISVAQLEALNGRRYSLAEANDMLVKTAKVSMELGVAIGVLQLAREITGEGSKSPNDIVKRIFDYAGVVTVAEREFGK